MPLISADKARQNSASFDLTKDQIVEEISHSIDANSKSGVRSIVVQYLRSAVSQQELEDALSSVRSQGYTTEIIENAADKEKMTAKICW